MEDWEKRGIDLLTKTLTQPPIEINEVDWKISLSDNNDKLAKHLSAFANYAKGGYMVFGVDDNGTLSNITQSQAENIVQKLGNLSRTATEPSVSVNHSIIDFRSHQLLLVHVIESRKKPVYIKSKGIMDAYIRSAAQSVLASESDVRNMIILSEGGSFEEGIAAKGLSGDEIIDCIDYAEFFKLNNLPFSLNTRIFDALKDGDVIKKSDTKGLWDVTNFGAILYTSNIKKFKSLERKAVRFIIYDGLNKLTAKLEQVGKYGYAVGFEGLLKFIDSHLPQNEVIQQSLRKQVKMYPSVAIREFVANALIHQDFSITGTGVTIELFDDRIEITNPGVPVVELNRFIDKSRSRNERLAYQLRQLKICEERGSGIDRAISAIQDYQLPAPKFTITDSHTKVTVFAHKEFKNMDKDDRIRACFQHCALCYIEHKTINNKNVRDRFGLTEKQISVASKILVDTMEAGLIKLEDTESQSKRYSQYVPFYA